MWGSKISNRLCSVAVTSAILLGIASSTQGQEKQALHHDCDYYRQGPVEELPIALVTGWKDTLRREPTVMWLNTDYIPPPRLPQMENGRLSNTVYADIDIETGLPPRTAHGENYYGFDRPRDWTRRHFDLLAEAYPKRPLWSRLGSAGNLRLTEAVEIWDGMFAFPIDGYFETGNNLAGFTGVRYPKSLTYSGKNPDVFIKRNETGEIYEVLDCRQPNSFTHDPLCDLHLKVEPFFVEVSFNKSRLESLDKIRVHTTQFTSCLLKE